MCSPSAGASISSQMVGRNPASVLPAPVAATSKRAPPAPRQVEHLELVPPRLPAARGEPVLDDLGQGGGRSAFVSLYRLRWRVLGSWIEPFPEGIYVAPGRRLGRSLACPRPQALVTHGHADHARGGHGAVWATPETLAIMDVRYGEQAGNPVAYGETVRVGEVDVRFVPAGHVLGSAQIVLEYRGERVVVSGDYKRRARPDLRAVRAGAVRHLHHRGDVRPAGVPPSRHRQPRSTGCSTACTPIRRAACWSALMRSARRSG